MTNRFDGILADPRVSFFGNVELGRDVSVAELVPRCDTRAFASREQHVERMPLRTVPVVRARSLTFFSLPRYDGTILAYGCDGDRTLDVPGEALSGVLSAREFVGWFNGDPRCVAEKDAIVASALANPRGDTAVIFGLGNVAVDCARILLRDPDHLAKTDVCDHALRALRSSAIRRVALVGRRGVAQAAFSPKELRELLNLPNVRVTVDEADMATEAEDEADLEVATETSRAGRVMKAKEENCRRRRDGERTRCQIPPIAARLHPMDATDARDCERVGSVTLALNRLEGFAGVVARRRRRDGNPRRVSRFIGGYRATPERRGVRPLRRTPRGGGEHAGRVATPRGAGTDTTGIETDTTGTETRASASGLYVCGWLKRGPTGIIGTDLRDAEETVASVVEDDAAGALARPAREFGGLGVAPLLRERRGWWTRRVGGG